MLAHHLSAPSNVVVVSTAFDAVERIRLALGDEFVLARCALRGETAWRTRSSVPGCDGRSRHLMKRWVTTHERYAE